MVDVFAPDSQHFPTVDMDNISPNPPGVTGSFAGSCEIIQKNLGTTSPTSSVLLDSIKSTANIRAIYGMDIGYADNYQSYWNTTNKSPTMVILSANPGAICRFIGCSNSKNTNWELSGFTRDWSACFSLTSSGLRFTPPEQYYTGYIMGTWLFFIEH